MDAMNNNQSNENKSQNELDLGLNQADSVTPRKPVQSNESFLDKAKGLKGLFGRKEQPETQFHVRKEPTFGESVSYENVQQSQQTQQPTFSSEFKATVENVEQKVESVAHSVADAVETKVEETVETVSSATEQAKESLAAGASAAASALKRPEKWKLLQILPEKHRRLFIAILALVLLLIVFFALKPNSDTVESFEQQNSNEIPVQFQSLDQSQPLETTVLDKAPVQPETAPVQEQQTENTTPAEPGKMEYMGDAQKDAMKPQTAQETVQTPAPTVQQEQVVPPAPVAPVRQEVVRQPVEARHDVVKHDTVKREAVKHEPVKSAAQERKPLEKAVTKPAPTKVESAKVPVQDVKVAAKNDRKPQVVDAKPAGSETKSSAPVSSGSAKTLTVPQGVSLMQVFRDNNLNISDVNAMTKANGAGNALSSFKPGDKVQVSVNAQGRVSELRLSNGAKFVRQSDGSYQFKK